MNASFNQQNDGSATRIRPSTPADAEPLAILLAQEALHQEQLGGYQLTPDFDWNVWLRARLGQSGQFVYLAEHGGQPVGFIYGRLRALPPACRDARSYLRALLRRLWSRSTRPAPAAPASFAGWGVIESIFVMSSARRQGVARRLITALEAELARHGIERIEISIMANNGPALALWSSLGFQPFREHRVKVLPPVD